MVSTEKGIRRRVSFRGENNEKLPSKPEEDENQAAENSPGSFVVDAVIQIGHQHLQLVTNTIERCAVNVASTSNEPGEFSAA